MANKLLIGLGALAIAGTAGISAANAAGPGGHAKGVDVIVKPVAENVAYRPGRVIRKLQNRGYYRIAFIDSRLPVYKVRACKNGKRFILRLNRWGEIRDREFLGRCFRRPMPRFGRWGGPRRHFDRRHDNRVLFKYDGPGVTVKIKKGH